MIAIVDDDQAVREALKSLVRSLGYNASTFGSAEEFLTSQFSNTSCIITDLQMPGLSGLDLQDLLIAEGHRIPIIFITGHPDENVGARAMKAGAIAFLSKPVNQDHLIGCLAKALKAAMEDAEEFLQRAKDCLKLARKGRSIDRPLLYEVADTWLNLAKEAALREPPPGGA